MGLLKAKFSSQVCTVSPSSLAVLRTGRIQDVAAQPLFQHSFSQEEKKITKIWVNNMKINIFIFSFTYVGGVFCFI